MRAVSKKRAREIAAYNRLRVPFLEVRDRCEFPEGCDERSTCVHHRRGRRGFRLLDTNWWAASCDFHNDYAETETGHSLDIGWLVRVESVEGVA